jgi:hypothetical protein
MNTHNTKTTGRRGLISSEQVAVLAYHLYLEDGCASGKDWEHWFRAEQLLQEAASAKGRTMSTRSPSANSRASNISPAR